MSESKPTIIGYTSGVYDLFHVGHLNVLRRARIQCDYLIVGVTTDELAMSRKGKAPVVPLEERMEIVEAFPFVDRVVVQDTMDKIGTWRKLQFNVVFVGDDWKGTDAWQRYEQQFDQVAVRVVYLPYTRYTSSSLIRSRLSAS